jgi:arylsulfatase A-like enzyme
MKKKLNRRDFLKLFALLPFGMLSRSLESIGSKVLDASRPNVLVIVFDAWSANNISLFGYKRETTPNLARLTDHATVYHRHYSAGNFTTPGTGSLLTGTYPWTHRGLAMSGTLLKTFDSRNVFGLYEDYDRFAFSQNGLVNVILDRFRAHLDAFILPGEQVLYDGAFAYDVFENDFRTSNTADHMFFLYRGESPSSLFAYHAKRYLMKLQTKKLIEELQTEYPYGVPSIGWGETLFLLQDVIDWSVEQLDSLASPFFSYLHFYPPHAPYCPQMDFSNLFIDEWEPPPHPPDHFSDGILQSNANIQRLIYDRYIADIDTQIGRMFDELERRRILDNTVVVLTTDHGEIFERGIVGHTTPVLYEPLIHIPLVIFEPGQTERRDVYSLTSCVDVLPTLLHLTGKEQPSWIEGNVLPPYKVIDKDRSIYVVEAKEEAQLSPLRTATFAIIRGDYKLVYYKGYEDYDGIFQLYNLATDPDELNDLYHTDQSVVQELQEILLAKIKEANEIRE